VRSVLNNVSDKIPAESRQEYALLCGAVLNLREKWLNYEYLYGHSQKRVEILDKCGSTFFSMVQSLFLDDFISIFSRLTDPVEKFGSNLSLEQLIYKLDQNSDAELIKHLTAHIERLQEKTANMRKHRNKRIAHNDYKSSIEFEKGLPGISRNDIKDALEEAEAFLTAFYFHFTKTYFFHDELKIWQGADILWAKLAKARAYEEFDQLGTVPHNSWRKFTD
jgi:hypothetical protein